MEMARNGFPFELVLVDELGWTPAMVRSLPMADFQELLAYFRLKAERANRTPTFVRGRR